jgi:hypothetical protein
MAVCPVVLIILLPTFVVHLSADMTLERLDRYMKDNEYKYEPYLTAKRDYYIEKNDMRNASTIEVTMTGVIPGAIESKLVDDLYYSAEYSEAFKYTNILVERYPYHPHYRLQHGHLLKYYRKFAEAAF